MSVSTKIFFTSRTAALACAHYARHYSLAFDEHLKSVEVAKDGESPILKIDYKPNSEDADVARAAIEAQLCGFRDGYELCGLVMTGRNKNAETI